MRRLKLLFSILAVLSVFLLLSGIASASEISLAKNVDPISPNIYRVGDTIHYVLTVGNPSHNTATNTLDTITDTLPDGSTQTVATDVVQEPGDSDTYDIYYVVDEADLQWISGAWRVVNRLEVDGTDSLGDIIDAITSKTSIVIRPSIDIEKYVNAEDADDPTGPIVLVGSTVTFTLIIENTGDCTLTNVSVDDDVLGHIGTIASLAAGGTATMTVTASATAGQYENLATVTGTPPVGPDVTDDDPGHYFGADPAIDIEKYVNGDDADTPTGPVVLVGSTVTFRFDIENTGNVPLTDVSVDDDILGHIGTVAFLDVGETATMTVTASATAGQYENLATVTGTPPVGLDVTDDDPGHYFGADPAIDLEKYVNGDDADTPTGPSVSVGSTVTFTFVVTNTGNVPLTDISVDDDIIGHIGDIAFLDAGESQTLTRTATAIEGQYENMGTATGTPPVGSDVTDEDPGHYFGTSRYEGFTPGFWKNHPRSWVGFNTTDLVGDVFDIPAGLSELADDTLMQALNYGGGRDIVGAARNLLRAAVAAILNAAHPNVTYPMSLGDIIEDVNEALASMSRTAMGRLQAILDEYNNLEGDISR